MTPSRLQRFIYWLRAGPLLDPTMPSEPAGWIDFVIVGTMVALGVVGVLAVYFGTR